MLFVWIYGGVIYGAFAALCFWGPDSLNPRGAFERWRERRR